MKKFRFSRLILFLYDAARLIVIVGIMTQLGKQSLFDNSFPYLLYASAQTLFPIMTWFIYFDAEQYLTYIPLNITGKCINIVLTGIWAFFTVTQPSSIMTYDLFVCLGLTLIILFTDIISIVGMVFIKRGFRNSIHNQIDNDRHGDSHQQNTENNSEVEADNQQNSIGGI
jgi:uncharacterized membrane protein